MNELEKLAKSLKKLPDETISKLLDSVTRLLLNKSDFLLPACPYCSTNVIFYGHKSSKQRSLILWAHFCDYSPYGHVSLPFSGRYLAESY